MLELTSCQISEESKDVMTQNERTKIINKCPWQHIPVFKRDNMRHNSWLTLTMEINLFRRTVIDSINSAQNMDLIRMLLYDDGQTCPPRVDIGISFKLKE
eukprot:202088_1